MATSTPRITYKMGMRDGMRNLKDKVAPNRRGERHASSQLCIKIFLCILLSGDEDHIGRRFRKFLVIGTSGSFLSSILRVLHFNDGRRQTAWLKRGHIARRSYCPG